MEAQTREDWKSTSGVHDMRFPNNLLNKIFKMKQYKLVNDFPFTGQKSGMAEKAETVKTQKL